MLVNANVLPRDAVAPSFSEPVAMTVTWSELAVEL
jgi:hypothetical protein